MKTSLKVIALLLAASVPSALAIELAGVELPAGADAGSLFGAFVVALVGLTAFADYARPFASGSAGATPLRVARKAAHPLAA